MLFVVLTFQRKARVLPSLMVQISYKTAHLIVRLTVRFSSRFAGGGYKTLFVHFELKKHALGNISKEGRVLLIYGKIYFTKSRLSDLLPDHRRP